MFTFYHCFCKNRFIAMFILSKFSQFLIHFFFNQILFSNNSLMFYNPFEIFYKPFIPFIFEYPVTSCQGNVKLYFTLFVLGSKCSVFLTWVHCFFLHWRNCFIVSYIDLSSSRRQNLPSCKFYCYLRLL